MKELFTRYYEEKTWNGGGVETVSGSGSTMAYTKKIREWLPRLISALNVSTILDAPCGDCNWIRSIEWNNGTEYIGADVVDALVEINQARSVSGRESYHNMDITSDAFPEADLWLCRDCFIHFSYNDIWKAIKNFLKSGIPYLLASTYPNVKENHDIATGDYRDVNLQLPPFCFGVPIVAVSDWIPGFPKKQLALWKAADLGAKA